MNSQNGFEPWIFFKVPKVSPKDLDIDGATFTTLCGILFFRNNRTNDSYPSQAALADWTGYCEKTVGKHIKILERKLIIVRRKNPHGRGYYYDLCEGYLNLARPRSSQDDNNIDAETNQNNVLVTDDTNQKNVPVSAPLNQNNVPTNKTSSNKKNNLDFSNSPISESGFKQVISHFIKLYPMPVAPDLAAHLLYEAIVLKGESYMAILEGTQDYRDYIRAKLSKPYGATRYFDERAWMANYKSYLEENSESESVHGSLRA